MLYSYNINQACYQNQIEQTMIVYRYTMIMVVLDMIEVQSPKRFRYLQR